MPSDKDPDLGAAYALETPQDNLRLYAGWADSYDRTFAADMDYQMPDLVAWTLVEAAPDAATVLDVGAGTGLVAQALPPPVRGRIDALDISPEMLKVAMGKGLYRQAIKADLTQDLPLGDGCYEAIVSAGTFTHGHVGPDALHELLRVARPGCIFVLAINKEHFEARGFAAKFAELEPDIEGLDLRNVQIYGVKATGPHKDDQALIAVFTKR